MKCVATDKWMSRCFYIFMFHIESIIFYVTRNPTVSYRIYHETSLMCKKEKKRYPKEFRFNRTMLERIQVINFLKNKIYCN